VYICGRSRKRALFFEELANEKKIKISEYFTCQIGKEFALLQPAIEGED